MRILFVDDDPDTRELAIRAVVQEFPGATVREAADLAGLERLLDEWIPDILVSDFDLRWSDGMAVFDRVKGANPFCCAVMFTGTGNEELAVRALKHGFDDYVVKGSRQLRRLAVAVRSAYDRARKLRDVGENRDLVLKELYHRLHNNLQIVISLLRLTERALANESDREHIADLGRRIQALSVLQEEFYRSEDFRKVNFASFLERLARNLGGMMGERVQISSDLEQDAAEMPVDLAVPFGLMANEILTDALRHAFPYEQPVRLSVKLERSGGHLVLTVTGDGATVSSGSSAAASDLSSRIVRRLAEQLEGDVSTERTEKGITCRIRVPL